MRKSCSKPSFDDRPANRPKSNAKSLFQKILAISRYDARFCRDRAVPSAASHFESEFYRRAQKKLEGITHHTFVILNEAKNLCNRRQRREGSNLHRSFVGQKAPSSG
jgi:hypothetical protein